jgi:hypothetical protein
LIASKSHRRLTEDILLKRYMTQCCQCRITEKKPPELGSIAYHEIYDWKAALLRSSLSFESSPSVLFPVNFTLIASAFNQGRVASEASSSIVRLTEPQEVRTLKLTKKSFVMFLTLKSSCNSMSPSDQSAQLAAAALNINRPSKCFTVVKSLEDDAFWRDVSLEGKFWRAT